MPRFRPDTYDHLVWQSVHDANEYGLPKDCSGWVVVDIGLHIGSFAALVKERGAAEMWGVEAGLENLRLAMHNVHASTGSAQFMPTWAACGRSDYRGYRMAFGGHGPQHTANSWVVPVDGDREEVPTIPLDDLLKLASDFGRRRISCLKLDCEGSEWPILFTSRGLEWVDRIYGEYHAHESVLRAFAVDGKRYGLPELRSLLEDHGFCVRIEHPNADEYNHFWAVRAGA